MTRIFKTIFIILLVTSIISCGQNDISVEKSTASNIKIENLNDSIIDQPILVDTFSNFPPEIDGCSCYFSNDSTEFKKGQYIYMNDFAQTSFLKINGVLTKFIQTEFKKVNAQTTIAKAKSDKYEILIEVKDGIQNGEETSLKSGTIKVTDKKGKTTIKTFYGECGC